MPLPTHDEAELNKWVRHIVTRWRLGHDPSFTIVQGICLSIPLTREDYFRVVRSYCDKASENRTYGKRDDAT
jgi:hypothetical protein